MTSKTKEDVRQFRELAERFAKKELAPFMTDSERYSECELNTTALKAAAEVGLLDCLVPEEYGGVGQGMSVFCEILYRLAKFDASFAAVILINSLAQTALLKWGAPSVVKKYMPSSLIAFQAFELPGDLPCLISAEKNGGRYVLNGKAEFVALAPAAAALILPVQIEQAKTVGLFCIDAAAEGVSVGEPVMSLGLRNCPVADVLLEQVKVPSENLLCVDAAADYPKLAADFYPAAVALAVGVLAGSYDTAEAYAKERYQGGGMIVDFDQVRLMLANMAVMVESGKALVRSMAEAADEEQSRRLLAAGLILLTEQVSRVAADGVQILGGYGYMEDYGQEKRMRDVKQIESLFGAAPAKRLEFIAEILGQEK